jgi:type IV secretory pathway TrbF-like protein
MATLSHASLPPIEVAARQEYEYYGSTLTTNTALKVALLIALGVIALLGVDHVRMARIAANPQRIVVRINDVGRAEAVAYSNFAYQPQAPEIRYFLSQFVIGYYGRNHKTVREQYVNSLYFLDRQLFNVIDSQDRRSQWLPKFLTSSDDDVNVVINNVVIEDLAAEPYRARVEFTKIFTNTTGTEIKRENWAAEFLFRFNPNVPNSLVPHNPLGLAITYFRQDQAFR